MNRQKTIALICKMIAMVIGCASIAVLLMYAVYLLPTEKMAENVVKSKELLYAQDDSKELLSENYWNAYDRGTNIIILHEIIYPNSQNVLRDALLVPTARYTANWNGDWADTLLDYAQNREYKDTDYVSYARYWHGYLIFLKPLFLLMDLQGTYILNAVVLLVLTASILVLLKKRIGNYWIAYLLTVCLMHPINIIQSYQLSAVFYAMQITMLLLLWKERWKKEQLLYIFVLDGVILSFLDFLTYPLAAFAIPVLTCFLLYQEENGKEDLLQFLYRGIAFVIGYAGMWGMKWIMASVFTEENVIADAIGSVLHRTGITDSSDDIQFMSISVKDALERNLFSFFHKYNLIIIFVVLCVLAVSLVWKKNKAHFDRKIFAFSMCIAVLPFVWMALLKNHCSLHPHLEWRAFSALAYALSVFVISLFYDHRRTDRCAEGN